MINKKEIKPSMIRSDLCDYSDAYIVVKGTITVVRPNAATKNKSVAFKNNAPFINCISKINGVKIDSAEDLDVVMPMYNLPEYSKNYKKQQEVSCTNWIRISNNRHKVICSSCYFIKRKSHKMFRAIKIRI